MFIAETRTFGFQNVVAHAEKQCLALPQTGPQICKLRTQGLGLGICEPITYRKHLRICSKKSKSTTNQQHHWGRFCNFQKKKRFYAPMYRQIWVDVFLNHYTFSPSSSVVKRLFPRGAAIFTAKWVGVRSRNFQRLVFVKENLDFLKRQRVTHDDFDNMPSTFSK